MGVITGFHPPDGRGPSGVVNAHEGALDRDAAEMFLRAQSAWLCRGLAHGGDREVVRLVLHSHDTCHDSWLALIAAANRQLGELAAQALGALYAGHGRVAESLERGSAVELSADVVARVRDLLADYVATLTEAAVAALDGVVDGVADGAADCPRSAVEAMADDG